MQVVCGLDHTLLLAESGGVFSCGWGADGQTGIWRYIINFVVDKNQEFNSKRY